MTVVALPIEADDALDALRGARESLGDAVDALQALPAPLSLLRAYTEAHDAAATYVERLSVALAAVSTRARITREMEDDDERRIEGALFPWTEDDR